MIKLTKKYQIVYRGNKLEFPLTEEGIDAETYPAANAKYAEFDIYEDAKKFIEDNNLVYTRDMPEIYNN